MRMLPVPKTNVLSPEENKANPHTDIAFFCTAVVSVTPPALAVDAFKANLKVDAFRELWNSTEISVYSSLDEQR